jgi:DNA repair photolyase
MPLAKSEDQSTKPEMMNGKPVLYRPAKTVLNMDSNFSHKLLCTGPVLNLGDACGFGCAYCSSPAVARKFVHETLAGQDHADVVVRRSNALELLEKHLAELSDEKKNYPHVMFSSSLVDIAANTKPMKESAEAFTMVLKATHWGIRTLTKSTLSRGIVEAIPEEYHQRMLFGISIGILDDRIAKVIENGTPSPTKRLESLHWLQDNGFRTYAMVCPSLPLEASPKP